MRQMDLKYIETTYRNAYEKETFAELFYYYMWLFIMSRII
jgi:hypothetical protein